MHAILRRSEPEQVYRELVEGLAANVVPMIILCGLLLSTGCYILSLSPSPFMLAATAIGVVASVIRIEMILHHKRHQLAYRAASLNSIRRIEGLHALTAIAVGLSLGFFSMVIYGLPYIGLHLVPACIAFGYGAGVISRVAVRPVIAIATIMSAGIPSAAALALSDTQHRIVAAVYVIFLFAGLQSIAFVYETARRAVTLRLQMEAQARTDPLTGLLNRFGLRETFETMLGHQNAGGDRAITVHAFDLDGFKAINDAFGHGAGDRLLALLAARIQAIVPRGTIAARTGGDEFVLLQPGSGAAAARLARTIHDALTQPCDIGCGAPVSVGLSLGYATGPLSPTALDELIQRADARSYAAKRSGGGIRHHAGRSGQHRPVRDPRSRPVDEPGPEALPAALPATLDEAT